MRLFPQVDETNQRCHTNGVQTNRTACNHPRHSRETAGSSAQAVYEGETALAPMSKYTRECPACHANSKDDENCFWVIGGDDWIWRCVSSLSPVLRRGCV